MPTCSMRWIVMRSTVAAAWDWAWGALALLFEILGVLSGLVLLVLGEGLDAIPALGADGLFLVRAAQAFDKFI